MIYLLCVEGWGTALKKGQMYAITEDEAIGCYYAGWWKYRFREVKDIGESTYEILRRKQ